MEDNTLLKHELEHKRDTEIKRITTTFKLDPYAILELNHGESITPSTVKKVYRSKSLLIHPDKTSNPDASKAFNLLKKAESEISNEETRANIDSIYQQAQDELGSTKNKNLIYESFKDSMIQIEFQRRIELKKKLQKQGEMDRLKDEELEFNRMKHQYKKNWEENQDNRVQNWRSYSNKVEKKKHKNSDAKKKKVKVKVLA